MKFTKMQAIGNDYIIINNLKECLLEPERFARKYCDRYMGIGADGVLLVKPSQTADFKMEIYNADGSRPQMCGNGIRCFSKYVYDNHLTEKTKFQVETDAGIRTVELRPLSGQETEICVDMGTPRLNAHSIPIDCEKDLVLNESILVRGREYKMTGVSMGNPHAVIFVNDVERFPVEEIGPYFEYHPRFPERINIEFVQVLGRGNVKMRVWERGVGETLACGTGACAVCVAGVLCGVTEERISIDLKRGKLYVWWNRRENRVMLTGRAAAIFEGRILYRDEREGEQTCVLCE